MTPAAIVDLNGDNELDAVAVGFDGIVAAIDGRSGKILWNYTMPRGESYKFSSLAFYFIFSDIIFSCDNSYCVIIITTCSC